MTPLPGRGTRTRPSGEAVETMIDQELGEQAAGDPQEPPSESQVIRHLNAAIEAAQESGMSASELMGLLFYYAHNVAQQTRQAAGGTPDRND